MQRGSTRAQTPLNKPIHLYKHIYFQIGYISKTLTFFQAKISNSKRNKMQCIANIEQRQLTEIECHFILYIHIGTSCL